ncbi:MAG: membrane dipeptidase [Clostridia bacterium]|nr:membrane dipeptidase [Clostridia bacterium]
MRIYGDLHCDTLWRCYEHRSDLTDPTLQLKRKPPFRHLQTYAIFIPDEVEDGYRYFRSVYAYAEELFRQYPEMVLCRTAAEIDAAFAAGKTPYLFSIEGGQLFGKHPQKNEKLVAELKQKGIVFMGLCYNKGNALAGGALSEGGLTPLGKEAALLLRDAGITVDLSHLNHRSADDVLALLPDHVAATHSNCYGLVGHPRNLTDEQIKGLIEKNGLMGINFYPPFLTAKKSAYIEDILLHIRYVLALGGKEILAFGSDFDGIEETPADLRDLYDLPRLGNLLNEDFLYGNLRRYLEKI